MCRRRTKKVRLEMARIYGSLARTQTNTLIVSVASDLDQILLLWHKHVAPSALCLRYSAIRCRWETFLSFQISWSWLQSILTSFFPGFKIHQVDVASLHCLHSRLGKWNLTLLLWCGGGYLGSGPSVLDYDSTNC